ncbi:hypothetical protein F383_00966 [Gossypium arboreum]|uniref:Uncharacterized protein n=1 Tax=Gossypium arboreum TaxID=29729 RepID=A0A0B0MHH8_GOSAR|nr:hypothetical protein F383_19451 [Gossypium arboreum]KHG07150.1 hypothetical protein F383_34405 [Gossypium arboreum]KHG15160.1 hypothetical protein F383_19514 [Gossypium arboreum]KHG17319.1 hypothetical protein F383_00966 [Gossypium arboreum]
MCCKKGFSPDG